MRAAREHLVQERKIKVTVGVKKTIPPGPECSRLLGPECVGRSGTPPRSPLSSRSSGPGHPLSSRASSSRRGASTPVGSLKLGPPESRCRGRPRRCSDQVREDILVPDFIVAESPTLLKMYQAARGEEIGPIDRCARHFEAAIAFCKLRWLIRLHYALISYAGDRCSLKRMLVGTLSDICNAHRLPHSPLEVYELVVQTLRTRFQQTWPLFLAYVGSHEVEAHTEYSLHDPRPYQPPYQPKSFLGRDNTDSAAFLWQLVDDIFIAWLMQQNADEFTADAVWQELDFYGVPRPAVCTQLEGFSHWQQNKSSLGTQQRHMKAAQRQAHHLAIVLELPVLRSRMQATDEEILEMARDVIAHPRTFNAGVRSRIAIVLQRRDTYLGAPEASSVDMDEEQLSLYLSQAADPRDNGRISPGYIEALRDSRVPWLLGRDSRFKTRPQRAWSGRPPRLGALPERKASKMAAGGPMVAWQP